MVPIHSREREQRRKKYEKQYGLNSETSYLKMEIFLSQGNQIQSEKKKKQINCSESPFKERVNFKTCKAYFQNLIRKHEIIAATKISTGQIDLQRKGSKIEKTKQTLEINRGKKKKKEYQKMQH